MKVTVGDIKNVPWNQTKATFSVVFEGAGMRVVIKDCRLIDGQNGLYCAGPSKSYTNKDNETKYLQYLDLNKVSQNNILKKIQEEYDHTQSDYTLYGEQTYKKEGEEAIPF